MHTPFFSIITTCFNSNNTIKDTLESVLNQSFQDFEYIICDAGSNDGTLEVLKKYEVLFNGKMKFISEPDEGIYDGMNKGVKVAAGKYVSILNSDDYYHRDTLKRVYEVVKECSNEGDDELPIVFGDVCRVKCNKEPVYRYHFDYNRIENNIPFGHPSMFVPKKIYSIEGVYNYKKYKLAADLDFQYRLYGHKNDYKWIVVDHIFTYMREGGATDNLSNIVSWTKEITELEVKYNGKNHTYAAVITFLGRIGRTVKNKLPYSVQTKMYSAYRVKGYENQD